MVTTTKAAAHIMAGNDPQIAEKASAKLARKREEAQRAATALNGYHRDTPYITAESAEQDASPLLVGKAPLADVPDPPAQAAPAKAPARTFSIATEIAYRGRILTVTAQGMTIDQFCDLMDDRQYQAPAPLMLSAPVATADDLPDGYKLCQKHRAPMRPRNKQNDNWHSHNVGTAEKPLWCKGYRGSDSPGYEVD